MTDDISRLAQAAVAEAKAGETTAPAAPALWCDREDWDEAAIPPRPWVVPGFLMRGAVTVIAGPGGVAKSSLLVAWTVSAATGMPFGRFQPVQCCRVLILNAEDGKDEQRMRISAALRPAGMAPAHMQGRVIRVGPAVLATLVTHDSKTGEIGFTRTNAELVDLIEWHRPDLLILDPLVELHGANENDNGALRQVIAHFRSLAQRFNMSVAIVHHSKKGGGQGPGDADSLRGASAIGGAARIVLTVSSMTAAEESAMGLPKGEARHLLRVDGAKANYSAVSDVEWFARQGFPLANGEMVAAVVPWTPPAAGAVADPELVARLIEGVAKGSMDGPWNAHMSLHARSVRGLFKEHGIAGTLAERTMLATLHAHGVTVAAYRGADRNLAKGLRAPDGRPLVQWQNPHPPTSEGEADDPAIH